MFTRMKVHDPEVKLELPIDATTGQKYMDEATLDGVIGWSVSRSNIDQMNEIMAILDEDLRQGALGIGIGVAYA